MTLAETLLAFRGYERKYFLDFAKHRLTAYMMSGSKKPINRWLPLPTDEDIDLGLDAEKMRAEWNRLKNIR